MLLSDENANTFTRINKQTTQQKPGSQSNLAEMIYIGSGIYSCSLSDLLPITKYKVCLTNEELPREGQRIMFSTGMTSLSWSEERLIHIIVIVCAMVLAVPAGMYACTTEAGFSCVEQCMDLRKKHKLHGEGTERQDTFDNLHVARDEGLCRDSEDRPKKRANSEKRCKAHLY